MSKVTKTIVIKITHDTDDDVVSDVDFFEDSIRESFSNIMAELKSCHGDSVDGTVTVDL